VHRHRLFTEHGLAMLQRRQCHLAVRDDRCDNANEIDDVTSDERMPVVFDMFDIKLARDFFGMLAMSAGDCDQPRAFAVLEARNLRRAREPSTNDAYAKEITHSSCPSWNESKLRLTS